MKIIFLMFYGTLSRFLRLFKFAYFWPIFSLTGFKLWGWNGKSMELKVLSGMILIPASEGIKPINGSNISNGILPSTCRRNKKKTK